jgi:aminoglycoside phosphotransferase (APT) family kinase protein
MASMPTPSLNDEAALAPRIADYLGAQAGHPVRVLGLRRFPVGFSWLTFGLTVEGFRSPTDRQELILRLGPDYGLFAPYRAAPQVLALQSLVGSAVPVPRAYGYSEDPAILGAPFLFCEKASGDAVVPWVSANTPGLAEDYRRRLAEQFIDALAALHRVDWQQQPIAALADPARPVTPSNAALVVVEEWERLIRRWAMRPYPMIEWALRWLKSHAPVAPRVSIVHGDYRTGNFLEEEGRITAILDWELVHLGDPHEDLGWASLPMYMGGSKLICRLAEPDWFYERYEEKVGFAVSQSSVRYYRAFSLLKLAATHMAAARCFEEGRFNDMRMPAMGSQIATCLRQLERTIETA